MFSLFLHVKSSLFGLAERITGLRESVADNRAEVEKIKRGQRLFYIVGGQVTKIGHIFAFWNFWTVVLCMVSWFSDKCVTVEFELWMCSNWVCHVNEFISSLTWEELSRGMAQHHKLSVFSFQFVQPIEVCYWIDTLAMCAQWMLTVTWVYFYIQCVPNGCYICTRVSTLEMIYVSWWFRLKTSVQLTWYICLPPKLPGIIFGSMEWCWGGLFQLSDRGNISAA